jgi:hypothetical protein
MHVFHNFCLGFLFKTTPVFPVALNETPNRLETCASDSGHNRVVPNDNDETVYLVADDFGRLGRAWREADYETTDLETVIQDLLTGQYNNPIRVVAFNTAERWSEDVSEDVAHELRRRCNLQTRDLPPTISDAWNGSARRA